MQQETKKAAYLYESNDAVYVHSWMGHKSTARIWGGARHEDTTAPSHPLNTNCHEE